MIYPLDAVNCFLCLKLYSTGQTSKYLFLWLMLELCAAQNV